MGPRLVGGSLAPPVLPSLTRHSQRDLSKRGGSLGEFT